jgi:hypothetical protein
MPNDCATRCSWRQGRGRKRARGEQKRSKDCGKEFEKKHIKIRSAFRRRFFCQEKTSPRAVHEARDDHIQCLRQCMREGPAVHDSHGIAPGDTAVAHEARDDHTQCHHECIICCLWSFCLWLFFAAYFSLAVLDGEPLDSFKSQWFCALLWLRLGSRTPRFGPQMPFADANCWCDCLIQSFGAVHGAGPLIRLIAPIC